MTTIDPERIALDPLLHAYVRGSDEEAGDTLEALLRDTALPVIRSVVAARLPRERDDAEDVGNEIVMQVVRRLRTARDESAQAIGSFRAYVATVAHRACDAYLRQKYPERYRLRNRVQYLATHHREFMMGDRVVALAPHPAVGQPLSAGGARGLSGESLIAAMRDVLRDGPLDIDALVNRLAGGLDRESEEVVEVEDPSRGAAFTLEQQSHLRRLWNELVQLPRAQRAALLLGLRGADGEEMTSLLPLIGIASIAEIARVLEIELERFAVIWNELPWSDARIADLLGITRQQVINLRKSARERLTRRMRR